MARYRIVYDIAEDCTRSKVADICLDFRLEQIHWGLAAVRWSRKVSELVTLELSEALASRAREIAARTNRRLEDILVEWLDRAAVEPPLDALPDDEVLALCDSRMDAAHEEELGELLARNREGQLDSTGHDRLEQLMQVYRRGLIRKAQALNVAVGRGLRPALQ